ncbi:MAG: hypothetical protein ACRDM1_10655 [Gaiellaceae bacterium]
MLLVLLAVEGGTLIGIQRFLTVHSFVGMLLIPIVTLKLASTGWRVTRYYLHGDEYVRRGPPHVVLRVLVAPVIVASTVALFGTGVALLALGRTQGRIAVLHKASFIVWFGATTLHVLAHVLKLPQLLRGRDAAATIRLALVGVSVAAGVVLALSTLPSADRLQDRATAAIGIDPR